MTLWYVHTVRYRCDWCGKTELGGSDLLPDGWEFVQPNDDPQQPLEHRCAKCAAASKA